LAQKKITGAAEPDVIVTIGGRIIQIQGERTSIRTIVPIAAADKAALWAIATIKIPIMIYSNNRSFY